MNSRRVKETLLEGVARVSGPISDLIAWYTDSTNICMSRIVYTTVFYNILLFKDGGGGSNIVDI